VTAQAAARVGRARAEAEAKYPQLRAITSGLNCGAIAVNHWTVSGPETPFGGRGDSGHGIEGGWEGVAAFRQQKFVSEA
jgi:acyl-CoA reductase-like NAD-dependent aldehyde dehydrogenase